MSGGTPSGAGRELYRLAASGSCSFSRSRWEAVSRPLQEGAAGRRGGTMTLSYCRETVVNKGIIDVTKFEQEVKKCFANPVTYPPAYPKPTW